MNPNLFVYGSLLSTVGHRMGERLRREARLIGAGSIAGVLHRVSWYPAAVDSAEPGKRVHGEVYALNDPAAALQWLDEYESVAPQSTNEYVRVERAVELAAGGEVKAWIYLYQGDASGLKPVPGGRWVP